MAAAESSVGEGGWRKGESCEPGSKARKLLTCMAGLMSPSKLTQNPHRLINLGSGLEGWLALASGESLPPHRTEKAPSWGYLMEAKT